MSKILCVDFDGVIHSYVTGWNGANIVADPPVPGALDWLNEMLALEKYEVHIYSSRSSQPGGIEAMQQWLIAQYEEEGFGENVGIAIVDDLQWPTQKPPAFMTIDDRAICFRGTFPSLLELDSFKPWNK